MSSDDGQRTLFAANTATSVASARYPKISTYQALRLIRFGKMKDSQIHHQPLVENYFAHGVDLKRQDNVISVKVLQEKGKSRSSSVIMDAEWKKSS